MKPWRLDGDDSLWRLCQWAVHSGIAVVEVNDSVLGQAIFEAVKIGLWLQLLGPWHLVTRRTSFRVVRKKDNEGMPCVHLRPFP